MPALFTHYELSKRILNNLNTNIQKEINKDIVYYNIFNQGWDNLFYYPYRWNYYRKFAIKAHKDKVLELFKNMINYIQKNHLEKNSKIVNMVYGMINHYILDTIAHPFINYQVKNLKIPHSKIEFIIDTNLREDSNNHYFRVAIPKIKFDKEFKNFINDVFLKTYNEKNIANKLRKSHNISYYLYRYFIKDDKGYKSKIYNILDHITPKNFIKFHEFTYYINDNNDELMNPCNKKWHHPRDKKEIYNYSFEELYNISLNICVKSNTIIYNILNNNKDINELIKLIKMIDIKNISELLH